EKENHASPAVHEVYPVAGKASSVLDLTGGDDPGIGASFTNLHELPARDTSEEKIEVSVMIIEHEVKLAILPAGRTGSHACCANWPPPTTNAKHKKVTEVNLFGG